MGKNELKKLSLLVGTCLVLAHLVSCAALLEPRTFADQMEEEEGLFNPGKDFPVAQGDTGKVYYDEEERVRRTPASKVEREEYQERQSLKDEMARLEDNMSPEEFSSWEKLRSNFSSDSERSYYLRLNPSERRTYLDTLGIQAPYGGPVRPNVGALNYIRHYQRTSREIYLGMEKDQVVDRWGRPDRVEIAGNPREGNERWTFFDNGTVKRIFFESGKVQGWTND